MKRVAFFLDGENLQHATKGARLDYAKLAQRLTETDDRVVAVYYFGAWRGGEAYLQALRARGVRVVLGVMGNRDGTCRFCRRTYRTRVEKQSDVGLAVKLLEAAIDDVYDVAVIVSADSDFVPAIMAVKSRFPEKRVGLVPPGGRAPKRLSRVVDFQKKMRGACLRTCQLAAC